MAYFIISTVPIRVTQITEDPQLQRPSKPIVGANGSHVNYLGTAGRLLTIEGRMKEAETGKIKLLHKAGSKVTVYSPSVARYNGYYHITQFTSTENKPGLFTISITLQEHMTYNVKRSDFVNYTIKPKTGGAYARIGDLWPVG